MILWLFIDDAVVDRVVREERRRNLDRGPILEARETGADPRSSRIQGRLDQREPLIIII